MKRPYFLDTNILIYAVSQAADHAIKRTAARHWVARPDWCVSTQVLMELFAQARQPRHGLAAGAAQAFIERIVARRPVQPVDASLVVEALSLRQRHVLSHWDAAILCAAKRAGAHTVISEDFEHDRSYDGVRVLNPFAAARPEGS